jgi:hypothetical protein
LAHVAKGGSLEFHWWSYTAAAIASFVGLALLTLAICGHTDFGSASAPVAYEKQLFATKTLRLQFVLVRKLFWCFRLAILLLLRGKA